jgi:hypothetical protein
MKGQPSRTRPSRRQIREIVALRAQGKALRPIADAMRAKGFSISHEAVAGILKRAPQ